ncbi:hypothetical protein [Streptomyces hydrogenans]|uniref:hypothetical protein n=1 Tax=Streptomyces hydrogenans TaxID=1873719 RepID=UPI0035E0862E
MIGTADGGWWSAAAVITALHCSAMAAWIPVRRFRIVYPFAIVGCGAVVAPAVDVRLYALSLVGLTVGLWPTRKLLTLWSHEIGRGVTRERYDWPRSHLAFCVLCVTGGAIAASVLAR